MKSELGYSTTDRVFVRGKDLCRDLMGHIDLGSMSFMHLTGRMPSEGEARVFNALALTLIEHGLTPSAIAARMTYAGAPESLQAAVAAGLCGLGSVFVGSSETVAVLLRKALADSPDPDSFDKRAEAIVADAKDRREPLPGIGHPIHRPVDPRTVRLFEIARESGFSGRYVAMMQAIHRAVERDKGRAITLNATGAIGALCCELDLPAAACRGIAVIARAIGLVGHLLEEAQSPLAVDLWLQTDRQASARPAALE